MMNDLGQFLQAATERALKELCFAFTSDGPDIPESKLPEDGGSWIAFSGPAEGTLVLRVRGNVLGELVANMLGGDQPPTQSDRRDGLCEIANVICGHTLSEWQGGTAVFSVTQPQSFEGRLPPSVGELASRAHVPLDGGRVEVSVYLRRCG